VCGGGGYEGGGGGVETVSWGWILERGGGGLFGWWLCLFFCCLELFSSFWGFVLVGLWVCSRRPGNDRVIELEGIDFSVVKGANSTVLRIGYIRMRSPLTRSTRWRMCRCRIVKPLRSFRAGGAGTNWDVVTQSPSSSSSSSLASCLLF